jgi:HD-GYP domain-containing protein (c-di-GMP phosphodiesterase class II)
MNNKLTMKVILSLANSFSKQEPAVQFLLRRIKSFDIHLYKQSIRAAYFSLQLAKGLNMSAEEQRIIYRSALLQDIGKLQQDPELYMNHPFHSVRLLQALIKEGLIDEEAILEHHENLDGTGYPIGATWENISLSGRILRIADSFAGMITFDEDTGVPNRMKKAIDELYRWGDMMYDSDLVDLLAFYYSPASVPANKKGAINYL